MKKTKKILLGIIIFLLGLLIILFFIRLLSSRQLDDVSPAIPCEKELLDKTDILMIVPLYDNVSIAENQSWCNYILSLNKTLALHGVYHTYQEFLEPREEDYIKIGMEEFKNCFGFYPKIFEAPQVALGKENRKLLEDMGFEIKGWFNMATHKVYHTQETGDFAIRFGKIRITNKLIDFI
ncbi:hypothetical protein FJZ17_02460 [Candidatus Pacearchaeota archaeon]|nr:hypothetical protein [Candidatus Pacearchaeota archaeon]